MVIRSGGPQVTANRDGVQWSPLDFYFYFFWVGPLEYLYCTVHCLLSRLYDMISSQAGYIVLVRLGMLLLTCSKERKCGFLTFSSP